MAVNQKITDLTADASPSSDDLVVTVNDPGGTPANRKVTLANLLKRIFTSGGTQLLIGALADGGFLKRSGTDIVTVTPAAADISDFNTAVRTNRLDQMAAPTADVSMNTHKITNVTDPAGNQDAATKKYVDDTVTGGGAVVANDSITYAKMQNISAASKLLGRGSAGGAGDPEEITLGTGLSMTGTTINASAGISGVVVRKNSGADVGTRARLNLIEGSNVTLTVADDAGDGEVDVTIAASSGAVSGAWDAEIIKSGDQTVTNNATPQADSELTFSMVAGGVYAVEFEILYSGNNTTGDYRWRFGFASNLSDAAHALGWESNLSGADSSLFQGAKGTISQWPDADRIPGTDAADGIRILHGKFMIRNSTGGANALTFMFANAAASSGRTSTTRAGSRIRYRKLN